MLRSFFESCFRLVSPSLTAFALVLVFAFAAEAQTQASCTFTFFGLGINIPNLGPGFIAPAGINDFSTIVGTATPSNDQVVPARVGFIRRGNGGFTFPLGTGSSSELVDRNDNGVSVGDIGGVPILLNGTAVSDITLNNLVPGQQLQDVHGINKWGSIVGTYVTDFPNGPTGFKRWSNGGFITLYFPVGLLTTALAINDIGHDCWQL